MSPVSFNIFIMKYLLKEMYKWNQHSDILAFNFEKQKHHERGAGLKKCMK